MKSWFFIFLSFFGAVTFFSWVNTGFLYANYKKINRENHSVVIPDSRVAKVMSVGHTSALADMYWINLIQHIGDTAYSREYERSLLATTDLITDLHPEFPRSYITALLFAPNGSGVTSYIALGEKGMRNTCHSGILAQISGTTDFASLWDNDSPLRNPCLDGALPYTLAYRYSNDLHDMANARKYYTIASTQSDAPLASRALIPLMDAKVGLHRTAGTVLLSMSLSDKNEQNIACTRYASELLGKTGINGDYTKQSQIPEALIERTFTLYQDVMNGESALQRDDSIARISCKDYFERAIRQIHLEFLEQADSRYMALHGRHAEDGNTLRDAGIISIVPSVVGKSGEFLYAYDPDAGNWDMMTRGIFSQKYSHSAPLGSGSKVP